VAVVLPVFDQAAFLGRAIGSLLAQSVTDWEAVVVDDGSTDGPDPMGLPLVRHDANRGLGAP
jgi:glycosyltransferase involved in cell wall biosynthesis